MACNITTIVKLYIYLCSIDKNIYFNVTNKADISIAFNICTLFLEGQNIVNIRHNTHFLWQKNCVLYTIDVNKLISFRFNTDWFFCCRYAISIILDISCSEKFYRATFKPVSFLITKLVFFQYSFFLE